MITATGIAPPRNTAKRQGNAAVFAGHRNIIDGAFGVGTAPAGFQTFRLVVVDDNANALTLIDQDVVPRD